MRYVVDSSVAIKWVLAEVHSDKAERLRNEFMQGIHDLLSPEVFHIEVAHSLTRAERQGRIAVGDAEMLWNEVMADAPALVPSLPLTPFPRL